MSTYRIKLIAAFCAIAAIAGSTAARADHHTPHANAKADSSVTTDASWHRMSDKAESDRMAANSEIHRASDHANAKKLGELKGKKVMGSDGEKLGDLHDFVIDAKSGKIAHAVVSTGGLLGVGDKLRVVGHDSLKHGADGLSVQMDKSAFEALPTVEEKDLEAGRMTATATSSIQDTQGSSVSAIQQTATADPDTTANPPSSVAGITDPDATDNSASAGATIGSSATASNDAASVSSPADPTTAIESAPSASSSGSVAATTTQPADLSGASSTSSHASASMHASGDFILASELDGKELNAGGEAIGTIEDVAIDLEQGTAMAVVKVKSDTAGGDDLFHVAFGSLQIDAAHSKSVSTTLARTDFTQATSTTQVSATSPSTISSSDESLTPTGRAGTSTEASESYGSTALKSSSTTTPVEDDVASTDAAPNSEGSLASRGSTYSSATNSTSSVSSAQDPAAVASETSEPFGSTADSSRASSASSDITAKTDASSTVSAGSTPASTPSGSMTTAPTYSSPGSSTTSTIPSVDTNSTVDSRSVANVSGSTDTKSSSSVAGPGTTETLTAEDEQLTPTGRSQGGDLTSAAAAIRSALNSDQTLASEDVKVQEAGRKIMLQGKVSSEDAKERIETLAKQVAGSAEIDSKLKVKDQE